MTGLQHDDFVATAVAEEKALHVGHDMKEMMNELDIVSPPSYSDKAMSSSEVEAYDPDHEGLEFPTEEEKLTLRRVSDTIPWNAYLIALVEMAERFSFYGSSVVFTNFIQQPLPLGSRTGAGGADGQSGALGLGQQASTGLTTFYQFWCYVTPLFGAYIADAHWGRYNTICVAVLVALIGHITLIIAAVPGVIEKESAIGAFVVGLIVTGFGTGLFKANISPLVAEQYRKTKLFVVTGKDGERVIVDPGLTIARVYMKYYKPKASDSESWNPAQTYRNMRSQSFWDDAKPSRQGANRPSWMTFDDKWVDEVQSGLKACKVFLWYPLFWLTYNQLNNNLTSQAATMSTHGLPNDILSNLNPFALMILIPICDIIVYPGLRRIGINFSTLRRVTGGFFVGSCAMIWAAVLQHYIYKTHPCRYNAAGCEAGVSPLNVWTQAGSYVLIALSEIFASITGMEYAYSKAPKNMRSLVMSVFLFTSTIASALCEAFVPLATDPRLIRNYGTMAVISGCAGFAFWFTIWKQDARDREMALKKES